MNAVEHALAQLAVEQQNTNRLLTSLIRRNAASVEALIFEEEQGPVPDPAGGTPTTVQFAAQTANLEIITGWLVIVPLGSTAATLTIGGRNLQVQNTTWFINGASIKVRNVTRSLTYTPPAAAAVGGYVALWGYAAPVNNAPGRLH